MLRLYGFYVLGYTNKKLSIYVTLRLLKAKEILISVECFKLIVVIVKTQKRFAAKFKNKAALEHSKITWNLTVSHTEGLQKFLCKLFIFLWEQNYGFLKSKG